MQLFDLITELTSLVENHGVSPHAQVAILDTNVGIHTVRSVRHETHEDADGSQTVWLDAEEY